MLQILIAILLGFASPSASVNSTYSSSASVYSAQEETDDGFPIGGSGQIPPEKDK